MRVFIALPVPEAEKDDLILQTAGLRARYPELKWIGSQGLHITLNFLGEIEERMLPFLRTTMESAAMRMETFDLSLRGLSSFPRKGPPRVIFVPVIDGARSCIELQHRLSDTLESHFPRERRRFTPHLTLARVKSGRAPDPERESQDIGVNYRVDRVVLYRSVLTPRGAFYEELYRAPFTG